MRTSVIRKSWGKPSTHNQSQFLSEGEPHNMIECLIRSTPRLIRNNGDTVKSEILRGKVVGIIYLSLAPSLKKNPSIRGFILDLAQSYNELSKSKNVKFEIVLIARGMSEDLFKDYLEMMPWLAIPFIDSTVRNQLYKLAEKMELVEKHELVLFDCHGLLLRKKAYYMLKEYGAACYPFTDKRIHLIGDEDADIKANMSLKKLLGNPTRDFVVANDSTRVPISGLEEKVVGIYFCGGPGFVKSRFARKLLEVYEQLKQKGEVFEVVMVYVELYSGWFSEKHLMEGFKAYPWLNLTHMDSSCRRMLRMFYPIMHKEFETLVILGPHGRFINIFGHSIINCYGSEAFPFSRVSTAEMVKRRLEKLNLKSLLTSGDRSYVTSRSVEKIEISKVSGTILLLFTCFSDKEQQLVTGLITLYGELKRNDVDVVLVASGYDERSFNNYYFDQLKIPWLALPYDDSRIYCLRTALDITCSSPTFSVFGPDGKLLSIGSEFYYNNKEADRGSKDMLLEDVQRCLAQKHGWPLQAYDDEKAWCNPLA